MLRIAALALAGVLLVGCEDWETSRARNERKLPAGCKIIDLDFGDLRVAVVCDGRKTTTSLRSYKSGRSTHYIASAEIGAPQ